jgi:Spy/CpxP family protein refolding chaperone
MPGPAEADDALQQSIAAFSDPFPPLTAPGVTFIARQEVSDANTYQRQFQRPTKPPGPSGITIGIGYDCRFVNGMQLAADWGDLLPADAITSLNGVLGLVGTPALLASVSTVVVPLAAAMHVFATRSLPTTLGQTHQIYPQVDLPSLGAARRTALVSLVYNRGNDLQGDRRSEMRTIRDLLAAGRFDDVADQFEQMTRLWNAATEGGLIRRRRAEATLWRAGFTALQLD